MPRTPTPDAPSAARPRRARRKEARPGELVQAALSLFVARWLGSWLFSDDQRIAGIRLTDRPAEARFHVTAIGLVLGIEHGRGFLWCGGIGFGRELGTYGIEEFLNKKLIRVGA